MLVSSRPVVVMQLPEQLNVESAKDVLQDLEPLFECHHPRIVLDCSQVRCIDGAGVEVLLRCLEEAMKRDGDLKLSAVSPQSEVVLELLRVDRVFEMFGSSEDAVRSFNAIPSEAVPQDATGWYATVFGDVGPLKQAS